CSWVISRQLSTPVSSSTMMPSSAIMVTSKLLHEELIHRPHTAAKTTARMRSARVGGPIAASSRDANAEASGRRRTFGFNARMATEGTTSKEIAPGTAAALNQLAQVTE